MKAVLVMPALNEEGSIGRVVAEATSDLIHEIIVVDNGSSDRTAEVAEAAGARVVVENRRGYGYACSAGAAAAADTIDTIVFMDGDGSDDASQVPLLLKPLADGQADLVLGARRRDPAQPDALLAHQRLGTALTAGLIRLLYGLKISDLPPARAIRRSVLAELSMREMTYGWPVEMIVKCARRGHRIVEVPVSSRPRFAGQSKVSGTVRGTLMAAYFLPRTAIRYAWRD